MWKWDRLDRITHVNCKLCRRGPKKKTWRIVSVQGLRKGLILALRHKKKRTNPFHFHWGSISWVVGRSTSWLWLQQIWCSPRREEGAAGEPTVGDETPHLTGIDSKACGGLQPRSFLLLACGNHTPLTTPHVHSGWKNNRFDLPGTKSGTSQQLWYTTVQRLQCTCTIVYTEHKHTFPQVLIAEFNYSSSEAECSCLLPAHIGARLMYAWNSKAVWVYKQKEQNCIRT